MQTEPRTALFSGTLVDHTRYTRLSPTATLSTGSCWTWTLETVIGRQRFCGAGVGCVAPDVHTVLARIYTLAYWRRVAGIGRIHYRTCLRVEHPARAARARLSAVIYGSG